MYVRGYPEMLSEKQWDLLQVFEDMLPFDPKGFLDCDRLVGSPSCGSPEQNPSLPLCRITSSEGQSVSSCQNSDTLGG